MERITKGGYIIRALEAAGFEAYYVGGCVRDTIMGREIHDIDITTSALPEDVIRVFGNERVLPTGIRHGTVTVDRGFEVTTFRIDGDYADSRRPENVIFTRSLREDLARRDLTMNAIAMDINGNIIDYFNGMADIRDGIIRCVGEPEKRFTEDALRILRTVRFASELGAEIESGTADAVHKLCGRLELISRERVREELDKLICGKDCVRVMLGYSDVMTVIIPELKPCIGFQQHSRYHRYTVWEHIVRAVGASPDDVVIRRAMLLHDVGKPEMFTMDENGEGHFKGHAGLSADMAEKILERLRYDRRSAELVCELIRHHSDKIHSENQVKHLTAELGLEAFCMLMECKKADNCAKNEFVLAENKDFDDYKDTAAGFVEEGACMSLKQLAVNGHDMMSLGIRGEDIGKALSELLELVMDGVLPNERDMLIRHITEGSI